MRPPWRCRRRQPEEPGPHPRRLLIIEGPSITADDWEDGQLKPGVIERFEADLTALSNRLRSL